MDGRRLNDELIPQVQHLSTSRNHLALHRPPVVCLVPAWQLVCFAISFTSKFKIAPRHVLVLVFQKIAPENLPLW